MVETSSDVPVRPFRVDMVPYPSALAKPTKPRSPGRRNHHLAVPEPLSAEQKTSAGFDGREKAISIPGLMSDSLVVEIRESGRRRPVTTRSGKSRDSAANHAKSRTPEESGHQIQVSGRAKPSKKDSSRSTVNTLNASPAPSRRDRARSSRFVESSRTAHSMTSIGAWSESSPYRAPQLPQEVFEETRASRAKMTLPALPTPPMTPDIGRLGTPELAPMAFDVEFCACCDCEDDWVSDAWHLAGRDKYDVQCECSTVVVLARPDPDGRPLSDARG
jgi:hypothetical protein